MLVELPFEFVNDTPADADEVNANFDTLVDAINSHFEESNPHGITPELIGAALAVHTHTWEQIQNKPESFPPSAHKHPWSDVEDVPLASLMLAGIVKLTSDRDNDSEELALTAKAMDDHVKSGDHDGRYYTKSEVNDLLDDKAASWASPSSNWILTHTEEVSARGGLAIFVPVPGIYRFQITAKAAEVRSEFITDGGGWVTLGGELYVSDSRTLRISDKVSVQGGTPRDITITLTKPCGVGWVFVTCDPSVEEVPHWEDEEEYGSETLTGDVLVSEVKIGGDISYLSASDVLSKFDVAT